MMVVPWVMSQKIVLKLQTLKNQKNSQTTPVAQLATSNESFNRDHSLRVLIVQRATQNCERSAP